MPAQGPLITAIQGFELLWIASTPGLYSKFRSLSTALPSAMPSPSERSAPALKALPLPVKMTARTDLSRSASIAAFAISRRSTVLNVFIFSGRFNAIVITEPSRVISRVSYSLIFCASKFYCSRLVTARNARQASRWVHALPCAVFRS